MRRINRGVDVVRTGPAADPHVPLVVQVSRWDRLKDMRGVLQGFAAYVVGDDNAQFVLAGPVVSAVADDPEGAQMLQECWEAWRRLPHHARARIALACVPMADLEENAVIVDALQRHASVVVQESIAEGFGLTVTEAMFKRRAVVASGVGGIADQIVDGESAVLLKDPAHVTAFADTLSVLLPDSERLSELGARAHERVVDRFLPDSHLTRWGRRRRSSAGNERLTPTMPGPDHRWRSQDSALAGIERQMRREPRRRPSGNHHLAGSRRGRRATAPGVDGKVGVRV
jgi:trehalose synthase